MKALIPKVQVAIKNSLENRLLIYIDSKLSTKRNKSFNLETIEKLILVKTNVTLWTRDHKLDPYGIIGTAIELYLADNKGEKHILIPEFIMNVNNWGLRKWNRFLSDLSALTSTGVFVSSGMMVMRLMFKLSIIIEVKI